MRAYDRSQILVSLHIPKTAGSSLREALSAWFGRDLALHYRGHQGEPPAVVSPRPGLCIHGHFNRCRGLGALQFYPSASQFIVFIRNPFDRFISLWRYLHFQKRSGVLIADLDDQPSFREWFRRRRHAADIGDDPFSMIAQLPHPIRDATEAQQVFGPEFLFVGLVENYERSLAALANVVGRSTMVPAHINRASDAVRRGDPGESYGQYRSEHERGFRLEYEVYDAAVRWQRFAMVN